MTKQGLGIGAVETVLEDGKGARYMELHIWEGLPGNSPQLVLQNSTIWSNKSQLLKALLVIWGHLGMKTTPSAGGFQGHQGSYSCPEASLVLCSLAVTLSSDLKDFLLTYLCFGFLESGSSYDPWHHVVPQIPHFQNGIKHVTSKGC